MHTLAMIGHARRLSRLAALAVALLASACAQHPLGPAPDPGFEYVDYSSPDGLVENFARAWRNLDADEYADRVLYDGTLPAPDGRLYPAFVFYADPELPDFRQLSYEEELGHVRRLFSGEAGRAAPGVESIELSLERLGNWEVLEAGGTLAGDAYPAGSLRALHAADLVVHLAAGPEGAERQLRARDNQELVLIPVLTAPEAELEYRLWKWWDRVDHRR